MLFFEIWYYLSVQGFSICDATLRDASEILKFKSSILAEFSIINFLENKSIFNQTKYAMVS